jgi:flavin-dependent dehydrogenase
LIAGAGPAGLATAINAASAGFEVAIFDPRPSPIDKACGEGLMPAAVRELETLGVPVGGRAFRGICYTDGKSRAEALFRRGTGLGVRRTELQSALTRRLAALGVQVQPGPIGSISQDERSVRAGNFEARYLIAADGLHSPIRHELGLDERGPNATASRPASRRQPPRWGLRQHFAVAPWTDLVEVHWSAGSEAYVTPIGPQLVGVALLGSDRIPYPDALRSFPALAERLPAEAVTEVRGAGPLRQRCRARVAGRVLLVGDAAGYVDALTGEGISISLACARAAVECLVAGQPEHYEQRWRALSRRYRVITESLLWARRRRLLARAITPAAARLPAVFSTLVNQLAR